MTQCASNAIFLNFFFTRLFFFVFVLFFAFFLYCLHLLLTFAVSVFRLSMVNFHYEELPVS